MYEQSLSKKINSGAATTAPPINRDSLYGQGVGWGSSAGPKRGTVVWRSVNEKNVVH